MIVKIFNNGWGNGVPLKQLEQTIIDQYLATDTKRTVLINSTWYTAEYHQQVLTQLRSLEFDQIVLVSMLDAAIPQPDWYREFNCSVRAVGYYSGSDAIDFWALTIDKYFEQPTYDLFDVSLIDTAYMCLNRKPHWHRRRLYNQLVSLNIVDQGIVSMGGDNAPAERVLSVDAGHCELAPNADSEQNGINNDIMSLGHQSNWSRHLVNVVTETQYNIDQTQFVSEKIYKPIVGCRPFLVYATGATKWLVDRGFEPYVNDFRDIFNRDLSEPNNIAEFLATLSQQPRQYWQSKFLALKPKIMYNSSNFQKYVTSIKQQIAQGIKCQI
jgi:hypothetical protein